MPQYLAIGVPYDLFMKSSPRKLKPFSEAYKIQRKVKDEEMWLQGQYFFNALQVSLSHFASKNSQAKYFEKPIMQLNDEDEVKGESNENCAIIEMKQRIKALERQGLPQSPM